MSGKIRVTPSTEPKIVVTPSTEPKIDPKEVAKALGAEPMSRPPYVFANYPEAPERQMAQLDEHQIHVEKEEWEQLKALAQELASADQTPTPSQVGRALLRKALKELIQGKQLLKASLQDLSHQAAE